MKTLALSPNVTKVDATDPQQGLRILRDVLLVLLAIMYSGGAGLLTFIFVPYLYALFYLTLFVCVILYSFFESQISNRLRSVLPYLTWIVFYCVWGIIVSPDKQLFVSDVLRTMVRHALFLSAIAISLASSGQLSRFAKLMQIAVVINAVVSLRGFLEPQFVFDLAYQFPNVSDVDQLRPAGLWINPNEAAFSFLLGFLMSFWIRGTLAWIGRFAAIIGIYLSVSRTGVLIVLICVILYFIFKLKSIKSNYLHIALFFIGFALLICMGWFIYYQSSLLKIDILDNTNVNRLYNYSEALEDDRAYLASLALQSALEGPWYGYGIFTFEYGEQAPYRPFAELGAHNIYLAVFGEIGIFGIFTYIALLIVGITKTVNSNLSANYKFVLFMMWLSYLIIGFAWHGQFATTLGIIYIGLLFCIPSIENYYA